MMHLQNEAAMLALGGKLAQQVQAPMVIFLRGDLGAGKTTLVRGFLQALGYQARVKSPSFTIVEPYELADQQLFHFDFYRLNDIEELELIGWRDYFTQQAICFIEWPEKAADLLPVPDLICDIHILGQQRQIELHSPSGRAQGIIASL